MNVNDVDRRRRSCRAIRAVYRDLTRKVVAEEMSNRRSLMIDANDLL